MTLNFSPCSSFITELSFVIICLILSLSLEYKLQERVNNNVCLYAGAWHILESSNIFIDRMHDQRSLIKELCYSLRIGRVLRALIFHMG